MGRYSLPNASKGKEIFLSLGMQGLVALFAAFPTPGIGFVAFLWQLAARRFAVAANPASGRKGAPDAHFPAFHEKDILPMRAPFGIRGGSATPRPARQHSHCRLRRRISLFLKRRPASLP